MDGRIERWMMVEWRDEDGWMDEGWTDGKMLSHWTPPPPPIVEKLSGHFLPSPGQPSGGPDG